MRNYKIISQTKNCQIFPKSEINNKIDDVFHVCWNHKHKKYLFGFGGETDPLKTLTLENSEFKTPIELNFGIKEMQISKQGNNLIILDYEANLHVMRVSDYRILKKLKLPVSNIESFVFANEKNTSLYLYSNYEGLCLIDLKSDKFQKLGVNPFYRPQVQDFIISKDHRILFGSYEKEEDVFLPTTYNLKKGKLRLHICNSREFDNYSNALSTDQMTLFSGGHFGNLVVNDLRSHKCISAFQFVGGERFDCLTTYQRFVYGGTFEGELVIFKDVYPFSILFYQKINQKIYSICFSDEFMVIGGDEQDSVKIYQIPK